MSLRLAASDVASRCQRLLSAVWRWLAEEKDSIASLATILQTIVVSVAVWLTVQELVLKDRNALHAAVDRSITLSRESFPTRLAVDSTRRLLLRFPVLRELRPDSLAAYSQMIDTTLARAAMQLLEVRLCAQQAQCDSILTRGLMCDLALAAAEVAGEFDDIAHRPDPSLLPPH